MCTLLQSCHSERPSEAGGIGQHESHEIQEGFVQGPAFQMVNSTLGCTERIIAKRLRELITPFYSAFVILHLECYGQVRVPQHKREIDKLEQFQLEVVQTVRRQEHLTYGKRLREIGLFSLMKRRLRVNPMAIFKLLIGGDRENKALLIPEVHSERMRGN